MLRRDYRRQSSRLLYVFAEDAGVVEGLAGWACRGRGCFQLPKEKPKCGQVSDETTDVALDTGVFDQYAELHGPIEGRTYHK